LIAVCIEESKKKEETISYFAVLRSGILPITLNLLINSFIAKNRAQKTPLLRGFCFS
jgi:hypothetical protein